MSDTKKEKAIVNIIVVLVILILGVGSYGGYFFHERNKELQNAIQKTQEDMSANMEVTRNLLTALQEEYGKKIDTVARSLEKLDQENKAKLSDLEKEVKNVNIKSGDFSAILEDVFPGIVSIVTDVGRGSGAIITKDGYVVTNLHVIDGARIVQTVNYNKKVYGAEVIGSSAKNDIAILKINGTFNELKFGDSAKLKVGERVVAVGNPAGLSFSVTEGIISQVERIISPKDPPMIQIDVPINPGNSGGPLISINGNIVGINRLKVSGYESLGFAIPSNTVKQVVEEIIQRDI